MYTIIPLRLKAKQYNTPYLLVKLSKISYLLKIIKKHPSLKRFARNIPYHQSSSILPLNSNKRGKIIQIKGQDHYSLLFLIVEFYIACDEFLCQNPHLFSLVETHFGFSLELQRKSCLCRCGVEIQQKISWMAANLGRRFWTCTQCLMMETQT